MAVVLLALVLNGCASFRTDPLPEGLTSQPPADWADRQQRLQTLTHWQLAGKLAVRQPSDSASAVINSWVQQHEHYALSLSSAFLGLGQTHLEGTPAYVELTLPDGETYYSTEPEVLIEAATGWQLPMDSLAWWIRGLPGPDADFRLFFDSQDQLAMIRQHGWEVRYDRWRTFFPDQPDLPARITATKDDKRVRIAVTAWRALKTRTQP
ncbi:lipoprotein insertase outer membrane protein LolB [Marinobacter sp. X15-166B]|uniref:lipoprotein insertase outer membrane protein LolB n=1 Tax=Marinobacter sp. X15-166B TaxID=1897620 RepID=UPI00085C98FD|nr:lipoprotein insertase outer membrane protein LolB [Marinobacter sp. X15-166B]OEY68013.1 outer membrane lipoprotein LolB [Marinobacter sp. X15-166B]